MIEESFGRRRHHEGVERRRGPGADEHSPYGLSASLWTNDSEAAERLGRSIERVRCFMTAAIISIRRLPDGLRRTPGVGLAVADRLSHAAGRNLPICACDLAPEERRDTHTESELELSHQGLHGPGRIAELADASTHAGISRPLLVTDAGA